jgi:hypothetical protein
MADAAPNYEERTEFWKPAVAAHPEAHPVEEGGHRPCQSCGSDCVVGSHFCHVCGTDRHAALASKSGTLRRVSAVFDFASLRDALGQTNASLTALIGGCSCLVAALVTGFLFNATSLLDWQAVQLWRIEWLLAAVALMVAGLLLKKVK